jgi:hypothetical protein
MDACLAQVREATGRTPQIVREIRMNTEQEIALEVAVPDTVVTVFLHTDTVQIESAARGALFWAEHWDYATPEEFLRAFRTALEEAIAPTVAAPGNGHGTA